MDTALWVVQGLLAAFFLMAGLGKLTKTKQQHIGDRHIRPDGSVIPIRILGVCEILGSIGIIVPWLTGISPMLTPIAALGFCMVMIGAIAVQADRREYKMVLLPVIILALAAVVAYFRFVSLSSQ